MLIRYPNKNVTVQAENTEDVHEHIYLYVFKFSIMNCIICTVSLSENITIKAIGYISLSSEIQNHSLS